MVSIIMLICGLAILGVWTVDIIRGDKIDKREGLLKARDPENDSLMLPHWIAEYATAFGLLAGAYGLFTHLGWAEEVALLSLGALLYTSVNSLSWALAKRERLSYAIPMGLSVIGAGTSLVLLFLD